MSRKKRNYSNTIIYILMLILITFLFYIRYTILVDEGCAEDIITIKKTLRELREKQKIIIINNDSILEFNKNQDYE